MSYPEDLNLCVAVPSMGSWKSKFGQSMAMMFAEYMSWKPEGVKTKLIHLINIESSMLVQNRHVAVVRALQRGATHVLFLDADIQFPKDLFKRMLDRDKDVVTADYTVRCLPINGVARDLEGNPVDPRKKAGMQKVRFAGLGCMMVKAEVLKKMRPPMFMMEWIPDHNGYCGEDVYFCQWLQELGYDIWLDHDISKTLRHWGDIGFSWDMAYLNEPYKKVMEKDEKLHKEHMQRLDNAKSLMGNN